MKNPKLLAEKKIVDDLFKQINSFTGDPFIKSLLTYYLCVRVSGFLENSVRTIFLDYSIPMSRGNVPTYISNKLKKFPNPTWSAIIELATDYNKLWADNLKKTIKPSVPSALDSINVNRNAIAHGSTSSITIGDLTSYYNDVLILIDELENVCVY